MRCLSDSHIVESFSARFILSCLAAGFYVTLKLTQLVDRFHVAYVHSKMFFLKKMVCLCDISCWLIKSDVAFFFSLMVVTQVPRRLLKWEVFARSVKRI